MPAAPGRPSASARTSSRRRGWRSPTASSTDCSVRASRGAEGTAHLTETNKDVVRRLLTDGFAKGSTADLSQFISAETSLQHTPDAPDGIHGLQALIEAGRESGETLYSERVHRL